MMQLLNTIKYLGPMLVALGLYLGGYAKDKRHTAEAERIVASLSSPAYLPPIGENNHFTLMHSAGSISHNDEIDVPLNYADYYFVEALLRLQTLGEDGRLDDRLGVRPTSLHQESSQTSTYWLNYLASRKPGTDLYDPTSTIDPAFIPNNFTYAGYHRSDLPLPAAEELAEYRRFDVTDYGAVADDRRSDRAAVIAAFAALRQYRQKHPTAGATLYFPAGEFVVHAATDDPTPIDLHAGHFLLQGAGRDHTTLVMEVPLPPKDPEKMWTTPYLLQLGGKDGREKYHRKVTSSLAPSASYSVEVEDASAFSRGDYVLLTGLITDPAKIAAAVAPYQLEADPQTGEHYWRDLTDGLDKLEKHQIKSVDGNRLTFYAPVAHEVDAADEWTVARIYPAEEVGIEGITFRGNWHEEFVHHKNALHDSGYSLVDLSHAANSWARDLRFTDFSQAFNLGHSCNVTLSDIELTGNAGHLSVSIMYGNNNLTEDVVDASNTWHAPGVSKYSISNVHHRMQYAPTTNSDLHGQQSMHNLFDNTRGGWLSMRWGGARHNQPNHLRGLIYWNHENTGEPVEDYEFMHSSSDYGRLIMPVLVGMHGAPVTVADRRRYTAAMTQQGRADYSGDRQLTGPQAQLESNGRPVLPRSLYEAQLAYRHSLAARRSDP